MAVRCLVLDENVPESEQFNATVQVVSECIYIVFKDGEWPYGEDTVYQLREGEYTQQYSFRGIKWIKRDQNVFTIYGDRKPIEITFEGQWRTETMRVQLTQCIQIKYFKNNVGFKGQVFEPLDPESLAPYMNKSDCELFDWSITPEPGTHNLPHLPLLDYWINRHFGAHSLNPAGVGNMGKMNMVLNIDAIEWALMKPLLSEIKKHLVEYEKRMRLKLNDQTTTDRTELNRRYWKVLLEEYSKRNQLQYGQAANAPAPAQEALGPNPFDEPDSENKFEEDDEKSTNSSSVGSNPFEEDYKAAELPNLVQDVQDVQDEPQEAQPRIPVNYHIVGNVVCRAGSSSQIDTVTVFDEQGYVFEPEQPEEKKKSKKWFRTIRKKISKQLRKWNLKK